MKILYRKKEDPHAADIITEDITQIGTFSGSENS